MVKTLLIVALLANNASFEGARNENYLPNCNSQIVGKPSAIPQEGTQIFTKMNEWLSSISHVYWVPGNLFISFIQQGSSGSCWCHIPNQTHKVLTAFKWLQHTGVSRTTEMLLISIFPHSQSYKPLFPSPRRTEHQAPHRHSRQQTSGPNQNP